MWENESQNIQPRAYLYPPSAPVVKPNNEAKQVPKEEKSEKKELSTAQPQESKEDKPAEDVNYLFLAQLVVCIAVIGFVLLIQKTNHTFYVEMGEQYKSALEQGVELTGENDLLKFTEEAIAQVRQAAEDLINGQQASQGAGGWNPTSQKETPPAGFSLMEYSLSEKPALPLAQFSITSEYGFRTHPITGKSDFHGGLDMAAAEGTSISAVLDGIVLQVGTSDSYGNYVRVLHKNNLVSTYNHMQQASVTQGQMIKQGQEVGKVGSTGVSTGPHLHLEFLLNGVRVNPANALEIGE